jgi:hypothetical protein
MRILSAIAMLGGVAFLWLGTRLGQVDGLLGVLAGVTGFVVLVVGIFGLVVSGERRAPRGWDHV